ncbi:UDP-N-acetylglucosamine 4,6-dehydratase [Variovorax sp. TBS-050B]|uniref:SDR family NAD(P)-dependent oxidoreductase n=1 Tax=Variovorax sp. TBS-050B TaxID=2940551 RepID=UPI002476FF9E|nr:SDR family NAD(P)-dependent oxidoreductase [Variovorax sp. TBS-050B]MDH6594950.1 UDP-N-acetylglucosamine 4,6-dehydratase [Variovorax sp. TBS-050B]
MNLDILNGKTVLVTGGTGSFGQAVVRRFLRAGVKEIRILSRDEKKQDDMRSQFNDDRLRFFLGDVRHSGSVHEAMRNTNLVFHAAALKQVPSCEFHPMEAVRTNVLGAENVISAAIACGVERVVALSTDKAVYPINAMGLSKAMMEKIVVARSRSAGNTVLSATRYGNVMASRGSVIPLFIKQLREGRDITITDPTMTRFLMSLDESVDLVLFAYSNAAQGDIFVQKAPAATVDVLAQALQRIFGGNSKIKIIGTRHGEKLYETLVAREEMARADDLGAYYRIPADARDLNYSKFTTVGESRISEADDYTSHNTHRLNVDQVVEVLEKLDYVKQAKLGLSEPTEE